MIKNIPKIERPREKLINKGVDNLTDSELLSIILKTGKKGRGVNEISYDLLNKYDNLYKISKLNINELTNISGIGPVKAIELIASFELGKRSIYNKNKSIKSSKDIYEIYFEKIAFQPQEELHTIFLNNKNEITSSKLIFKGTINTSQVFPRDILREALKENACSIALIHNHPSGDITPSQQDIIFTKEFKKISKSIGINLIDHIIIGYTNYYSFSDNGW